MLYYFNFSMNVIGILKYLIVYFLNKKTLRSIGSFKMEMKGIFLVKSKYEIILIM